MKKIIILSFIFLVACQNYTPQEISELQDTMNVINGTIVNQRNTAAAKSVVLVQLQYADGTRFSACTGTLIGKNTVLTAAHCLEKDYGTERVEIQFSNNAVISAELSRASTAYSIHPKYNTIPFDSIEYTWNAKQKRYDSKPIQIPKKNYNHDIGIIVFIGSIPEGFAPVAIDSDTQKNYAGSKVYLYGYGRTIDYSLDPLEPGTFSAGQLHKGELIVDTDYFAPQNVQSGYFFIRSEKGQYLCQGDSGGPQFFHENNVLKLIGVNSCSSGDMLPDGKTQSCVGGRGKSTRVADSYAWIKAEEKKLLKQIGL